MFDPTSQGLLAPLIYLCVLLGTVLILSLRYSQKVGSLLAFGYLTKIVGTIIFVSVYVWYYGDGDTFIYYEGSRVFFEAFIRDPSLAIGFLFQEGGVHNLSTFQLTLHQDYFKSAEWTFIRITSFINFFCFNNFYCLSLVFGSFAYGGLWLIYRTFSKRYSGHELLFFVAVLLSPSIFMWTSGLLKDSFCVGFLGLAFWSLDQIVRNQNPLRNAFILVLALYFISIIKFYLFVFFTTATAFYMLVRILNFTEATPWVRWTVFSFSTALATMIILGFQIPSKIEGSEEFGDSMDRLYAYHAQFERQADQDDSKYALGEIEYNIPGLLGAAPIGFITSVFRPFPWESRKPMMAFMSLESTIILLLSVLILLSPSFWKHILRITANPEITFCLVFVILLGTIAGITSYNFGLLMRLKSPMMPFLGAAMVIIYSALNDRRPPRHAN